MFLRWKDKESKICMQIRIFDFLPFGYLVTDSYYLERIWGHRDVDTD